MKKKIKYIIILVVLVILFVGVRFPSTETLSLDEIKSRIKDTKRIYVCQYSEVKDNPCSKSNRINTIEDEEKIRLIVDGLQEVEAVEDSITAGSGYTIYFMNKDDKVVACANYAGNIVFRTWKKEYVMDVKEIENLNLKELFGTKV